MITTKSKLLVSSIISIIGLIIIAFAISNSESNNKTFYLEDKYYNNGEKIELDENSIKDISDESYLLFTYNTFCGMAKPCEEIFDAVLKRNNLDYIAISFDKFKKTDYYETVKYAPSFIIIKKGKIVAYLDAEKDEDLDYYQDEDMFEKWLGNYINLKK